MLTEVYRVSQDGGVSNGSSLARRLAAEFLGSAFLAAIVVGSGIAASASRPATRG
jgi:hypothetical protein